MLRVGGVTLGEAGVLCLVERVSSLQYYQIFDVPDSTMSIALLQ